MTEVGRPDDGTTGDGHRPRLLAFATQGAGGDDESRLRVLLSAFPDTRWFPFDPTKKRTSFASLWCEVRRERPDLIVMEGTGIAGGLALLLARVAGFPYVFSSGDAVGPFVGSIRPMLGPMFGLYERWLCRHAAGFIGWSPYLAGRALTFGAPRSMTAAGWGFTPLIEAERKRARAEIRAELRIPEDAIVFGIVGSLAWNRRVAYCYGYELVRAIERVERDDVWVVVVGDGSGRERLEGLITRGRHDRCRLIGRIPRLDIPRHLAAFDVASLPQSLDGVGLFRYTTKISEYAAAGLPLVTGRLPLAYDLDHGWIWRLPGDKPWAETYIAALADFMERIDPGQIAEKRAAVPQSLAEFDQELQVARTTAFLNDILSDRRLSS